MLNYNLDTENDDKFILGYEYGKMYFKDDGKTECKDVIIPKYDDGHLEYLDDTKENRIMLLNKLKKQIIDSKSVIEEVKSLNRGTNLQKYGTYTLMLVSLVYTLNSFDNGKYILFALLSALTWYLFFSWRYYASVNGQTYDILDDYEKNMFYLENEELFKSMDYDKDTIFKGLKKKNINFLNTEKQEKDKVNPNSIDSLSIKELKLIKNNYLKD